MVKIHGGGTAFALPPLVRAIFYREICHRCLLTMELPPLPHRCCHLLLFLSRHPLVRENIFPLNFTKDNIFRDTLARAFILAPKISQGRHLLDLFNQNFQTSQLLYLNSQVSSIRMAEQGDQGDVYQVNKLIEMEHLDWSKQLEKAVRGF